MNETIKTNFRPGVLHLSLVDAKKFYYRCQPAGIQSAAGSGYFLPHRIAGTDVSLPRRKSLQQEESHPRTFVRLEALGIQGRVDLMTTDCKLLVDEMATST